MKKYASFKLLIMAFVASITLNSCGYNSMVKKSEEIEQSWANVQSQYQRRADLIPNLVNTVKGAADFEKETLTGVIEARAKATQVTLNADELSEENLAKFQEAQAGLGRSLGRLLVSVERYPELKANANFRDLQAQLEGTENRITVARDRFNLSVQEYNSYIRSFPRVIFASTFGFEKKAYFKADAGTEDAPKVEF